MSCCGLTWLLVCFWVHVNIVVSYRIVLIGYLNCIQGAVPTSRLLRLLVSIREKKYMTDVEVRQVTMTTGLWEGTRQQNALLWPWRTSSTNQRQSLFLTCWNAEATKILEATLWKSQCDLAPSGCWLREANGLWRSRCMSDHEGWHCVTGTAMPRGLCRKS